MSKQDRVAINATKKLAQKEFIKIYGFAPALKDMIELEGSFKSFDGMMICESLAFAVNKIGYSYSMKRGLERAEAYDM